VPFIDRDRDHASKTRSNIPPEKKRGGVLPPAPVWAWVTGDPESCALRARVCLGTCGERLPPGTLQLRSRVDRGKLGPTLPAWREHARITGNDMHHNFHAGMMPTNDTAGGVLEFS